MTRYLTMGLNIFEIKKKEKKIIISCAWQSMSEMLTKYSYYFLPDVTDEELELGVSLLSFLVGLRK